MTEVLRDFVPEFANRRVLVVGDAILDIYVQGDVSRTSPEAPVPVLHVKCEEALPGGAANVVRNLSALGARVEFVALRGDDEPGRQLEQMLEAEPGVRLHLAIDKTRPTVRKTRCMSLGQQMLRFDHESPGAPAPNVERRIITAIRKAIARVDGVILSDYAKGVLTDNVLAETIRAAKEARVEVIVDPKGADYAKYRGATLITPNRKEAEEASGVRIIDEESTAEAARKLQRIVRGKAICITLGAGGVAVFPRNGAPAFAPAAAREVYDVTGGGDTAISALSLARFSGATFAQAARIGNAAAGIAVGRVGVATVSPTEVAAALVGQGAGQKRVGQRELLEVRRTHARAGKRVVMTNGCFDILSVRHVRLLEQARMLGDILVVALNSDESVRRIKGEPRPLLDARERMDLLAALPYVDYVTVFDEDTPENLLRSVRPDILVKGTNVDEVVGREIVEGYGGEVKLLELGWGPSAMDVIERAGLAPPTGKRKAKKA